MIGLTAAGLGIAGSGSGVVSDTELVAKHQDLKILVMVR